MFSHMEDVSRALTDAATKGDEEIREIYCDSDSCYRKERCMAEMDYCAESYAYIEGWKSAAQYIDGTEVKK